MAESNQHIMLVRHLYSWVAKNLFNGDTGLILVDLPEVPWHSKPQIFSSGVRPDLCATRPIDKLLIIGEAKTTTDLEKGHSVMQYNYYIDECEKHTGPGLIVMAVPWHMERSAYNLLLHLVKKKGANKTQVKVLKELPG